MSDRRHPHGLPSEAGDTAGSGSAAVVDLSVVRGARGLGGTPPPGNIDRRQAPRGPSSGSSIAVRLVVFIAVAALGAVALGPRLLRGDLPADPELLGTSARGVVKADRDYALVDDDLTDEHRARAASTALPMWDMDDVVGHRNAQVLQKALVRTAVAIETFRRQQPEDKVAVAMPQVSKAFDEVRAVAAGELAASGLEAPRDEEWQALFALLWSTPGAADALAAATSSAMMDLTVNVPAGGPLGESEQIRVRGVRSREEQTVDVKDISSIEQARRRFQKTVATALTEIAPATVPSNWRHIEEQVGQWLASYLQPNLTWNAAETEQRRRMAADQVAPVIVRAYRGETVLRPGEVITRRHQLLVRAMAVQQAGELRTRATLGTGFFVALVCAVVYLFGARRIFQRRLRSRDVVFLGVLVVVELGLLAAADIASPALIAAVPGLQAAALAYALPVAFGPMCVRLTLPPDVALLFALVVALLGGVVVEGGMTWAVATTLGSMSGIAVVTGGPRRLTLLLAGLSAGLVGACATLTLELFRGALTGSALTALLLACIVGGTLSGIVAMIFVPIIERLFGYVTDQRLYRLADLNSPLLKDLIVHAPGTWHHSVRVAVLAEHAAAAVGANPLLARVMSLYHDIGKISRPASFRENQTGGPNPHDALSPEESASILRGHVEEGLSLAREHGLPTAVAAVIEEHHADSVMVPFLEKAMARTRESGQDVSVVDQRLFRYGGRRPHSKESALVMLADHIESAARELKDDRVGLTAVVDDFVNRALTSDLLAACDLSLRDLERARSALKDALIDLSRDPERERSGS